jgi:hypothetical protein
MNSYEKIRTKQQEEINAFPFGWAFSQKQFEDMMVNKFGLKDDDYDKIYSIGHGGFIRKTDADAMDEMLARHKAEREEGIAGDPTGDGFIFEMFSYEVQHCYDWAPTQPEAALSILGMTMERVKADARLEYALNKALKLYCKDDK